MNAITIQQEARALNWADRISLARANSVLAPIYIQSIADEAHGLKRREYDENHSIEIAAHCLLTALSDFAAGEFDADDLVVYYEELDGLVCEDEDQFTFGPDEEADWRYDCRRNGDFV